MRNSLTDNVVPYWDVFNKCFIPMPTMGSGVYMKMTKGNMYSMAYMRFKNNVLFRNNMSAMLNSEEVEKDKTLVKAESGLNTTAHQQDLVTDTPSYFSSTTSSTLLSYLLTVGHNGSKKSLSKIFMACSPSRISFSTPLKT